MHISKAISSTIFLTLMVNETCGFSFENIPTRREFWSACTIAATTIIAPTNSNAAAQESLDIETFLRTGIDTGGGMTVSSQAGKSRPQTGVVFRDGSDVSQDRSGAVAAEILVGTKKDPQPVLVSFVAPWKLEKGSVFDVECRDGRTGEGAFLAVTQNTQGKSLQSLPNSFFLERLFDPTGRFSFYGPPTDIKVKSSRMQGDNYRRIELTFSSLSQSTNAEIPRRAVVVATIPAGTENAVMLVGSASASRWKVAEPAVLQTVESFRAVPAPKSGLKIRAKDRSNSLVF
ncbi:hypothetical protein FisN_6Lh058 [Fistulifera solaris]|uniref:NADH:ubiquinone oxidoreductase intermediate-associated protein 30 domain-containing protein n=1 Tax=Fistulifera solaris TaxID=1519565 RepID=A0A1Z5KPS5_FISSO|nr:hypothetical protein FisN_6Lh058 [Fistulifera solaris]|eukprot:GAX28125.1 hypothetical protein FisN_6Lh058 [Fistulifera solaris]